MRFVSCPAKCERGRVYLDNGPSGLTEECFECGGEGIVAADDEEEENDD